MALAAPPLDDTEPEDEYYVGVTAERPRVAFRILRVWELVEYLAAHPGASRKELANKHGFSERQMQADLNMIRNYFGLPLVRRNGYRFDNDKIPPTMTFADLQTLLLVMGRALHEPTLRIPADRVQSLAAALPSIVPAYLRPLVRMGLSCEGKQAELFTTIAQALVARSWVTLRYPDGEAVNSVQNPTVQPLVVLPYSEHWWLLGRCRERAERVQLFPLEQVLGAWPVPTPMTQAH